MARGRSSRHGPVRSRVRALRFWALEWLALPVIFVAVKLYSLTLRMHWEERDAWEATAGRPRVLAFWHGDLVSLFLAIRFLGRRSLSEIVMMSSPSRDGKINAKMMRWMGLHVVVGSSARRGAAALVTLSREIKDGRTAGIAVDGPRGPRHEPKPGAALLASKTAVPIVATRAIPTRAWRLGDWAKTEIPKPFTRLTLRTVTLERVGDVDTATAWIRETLGD